MKRRRSDNRFVFQNDVPLSKREIAVLTNLLICVLEDVSSNLNVNLERDVATIISRSNSEGFAFVTKSLPRFADFVLLGLESGRLTYPASFPFGRIKRGTELPNFLKAVLSRIFDIRGDVLVDADAECVRAIEQICNLFKKYETPLTKDRQQQAFEEVLALDSTLPSTLRELLQSSDADLECEKLVYVASVYLEDVLGPFDAQKIVPRHGPGSTAAGSIPPWKKYDPGPVDEVCLRTFGDLCLMEPVPGTSSRALCRFDPMFAQFQRAVGQPVPVQHVSSMSAVAKDSRGPRVIQAETSEYMYLQQGIWNWMKEVIQTHPLTAGHVNFDDQTVNQELARVSSIGRHWATLDLKDASNRNSLALVYNLMPEPLLSALLATRSTHTLIRRGNPYRYGYFEYSDPLKMFAPMGSAVCFPVQSMVYWSLCIAALIVCGGWSPGRAIASVFVYGDDIIVPTQKARLIERVLTAFGMKVNTAKSFINGFYRESCGLNAFKGVNTTPIRIKKRLPQPDAKAQDLTNPKKASTHQILSHLNHSSVIAWVEYSNAFHKNGYWKTADFIRRYLEDTLRYTLPVLPENSGALGLFSFCGRHDAKDKRWHCEKKSSRVRKLSGRGFHILDYPSRPNYQGTRIKVLRAYTPVLKPGYDVFPEEKAYLRYFIERPSAVKQDQDGPAECWRRKAGPYPKGKAAGSARMFTVRDEMRLQWDTLTIT